MKRICLVILFSFTFSQYNDSWGLVIGINKYEKVSKLDFAVDDAIAIKDMLIETFDFPEDNITMLLDEEATKDNIVKAFSNIASNAQDGDRVLVFYAGHGETMELAEGGQMGYLIPVDGDADNLYYSSIPMGELKNLALMSKAKHMLYLVDACYGGLAAVGTRGLSTNTPNYIQKVLSDKARQVITAGGKGEQVIEKSEWGHSAFTLNLKRGLKDGRADVNYDGYITANELGMFLSEKVTIDSENQQTPQYGRMTSQEGEFVFVYNDHSTNSTVTNSESSSVTDQRLVALLAKLDRIDDELTATPNKKSSHSNKRSSSDEIEKPLFSIMSINNNLSINVSKFLDEKSIVGVGYSRTEKTGQIYNTASFNNSLGDTDALLYSFETATSYGNHMISNINRFSGHFTYYPLGSNKTPLFNPKLILNTSYNILKVENRTQGLNGKVNYLSYGLGLINRVNILDYIGIGVGLFLVTEKYYDFIKNPINNPDELVHMATDIQYSPSFTIDVGMPFFTNLFSKK